MSLLAVFAAAGHETALHHAVLSHGHALPLPHRVHHHHAQGHGLLTGSPSLPNVDLGHLLAGAWRGGHRVLIELVVFAGLCLASRTVSRRRRRYVRLWLIPHRTDEAEPEDVLRLVEVWHQQLLERWYRRVMYGQPSIALEAVMAPDKAGVWSARLSIVCPVTQRRAIEGALIGCYPDCRLVQGGQALPPTLKHVVRLKKRRLFLLALRGYDEERHVVDSLLNVMGSVGETSAVQYVLTPAPVAFDRYSRWRFSARERRTEGTRRFNPARPGLRSELVGQELQGGLRVQHRPLFFSEIRVAAASYAAAHQVAGALRGASVGENSLEERRVYSMVRRDLCLRRLAAGTGNLMPGWRHSVLSSPELASMWRLPSPGLRSVSLVRTSLPRMPASPEVTREAAYALGRDELGAVGIRPGDKAEGLGLIGGQKTGKTSVLCRTVQADARDESCAMIVLMPKPGDALKALSMVPRGRTVHYLDLERPEFGINPLLAEGDAAMVADRIVDAFRDINAEGDIRGSSDRFLRQAAQAAIGASRAGVIEEPPNLWHMYRMLLPGEESFREHVVRALEPFPHFADTAMFFGRDLPGDLRDSPGQTTAKLDAPRNKLLRLLVESLDRVLRHPLQISLAEIVARREVLIVDGKMGTFGADNCRVMMQFILNTLYAALQRQQQLPDAERVRVAVKIDEAHLVLNESFADAMATLRSAGLEIVAAWQYGEQIQDPKIRGGMLSLLRQRCMFSMGEAQDARELSTLAMSAYSDMIRPDVESRQRLRVTPDTIFNLPNFHAVCSWISAGARVPAFIAQTLPLETDQALIDHHLAAQRERGCYVADQLSDPLPDHDWHAVELPAGVAREEGGTATVVAVAPPSTGTVPPAPPAPSPLPPAAAPAANGDGPPAPPAESRAADRDGHPPTGAGDPRRRVVIDAGDDDHAPHAVRPAAGAPPSFAELDLDDVRGLQWDKVTLQPPDKRPEPTTRELEILAALWEHRFLFSSQIWRKWWPGSSVRASQQTLNRMARAGWVRRFKFLVGERGAQQRVYCLTKDGFELGRQHTGRRGPYIPAEASWREPQVSDARRVLRDLHVNGWALAFERVAGRTLSSWRGARSSRLEPPRRRVRGEWKDLVPSQTLVGSGHRLRDYAPDRFEPVSPDTTLELRLQTGDGPRTVDLLLELDRARGAAATAERLRRYDGFLTAWARSHGRYKALGTPPMVVFVSEDEHANLRLLELADRELTARLAKPGAPEAEWPSPARATVFFVQERDIHEGSLQALALPPHGPEQRVRLEGRMGKPCRPRRVQILGAQLLHGG